MLWFVLARFPGALHLLQLCLAERTKIVDQQICVIVSLSLSLSLSLAAMSFGGLIAVLMFVVGVLSWEFCFTLAMRSAHVVFVVCVGNVQCVCEFGRSCVCHCCSLV